MMSVEELNALTACPACREPLQLIAAAPVMCGCGQTYAWVGRTWRLIPASAPESESLWRTWEQLQWNGAQGYEQDPVNNLGIGERPDASAFGRFCRLEGRVLDVGCGPQAWPSYFEPYRPQTTFIGVDPLAVQAGHQYRQLQALGESLPFRPGVFDRVLFATSLDHFITPEKALREAHRVCAPGGEVEVWIGEKSPDAPRPATSPAWYTALEKPPLAEDLFHFKRLSLEVTLQAAAAAGLAPVDQQTLAPDPYRRHYFLRFTPDARAMP